MSLNWKSWIRMWQSLSWRWERNFPLRRRSSGNKKATLIYFLLCFTEFLEKFQFSFHQFSNKCSCVSFLFSFYVYSKKNYFKLFPSSSDRKFQIIFYSVVARRSVGMVDSSSRRWRVMGLWNFWCDRSSIENLYSCFFLFFFFCLKFRFVRLIVKKGCMKRRKKSFSFLFAVAENSFLWQI